MPNILEEQKMHYDVCQLCFLQLMDLSCILSNSSEFNDPYLNHLFNTMEEGYFFIVLLYSRSAWTWTLTRLQKDFFGLVEK